MRAIYCYGANSKPNNSIVHIEIRRGLLEGRSTSGSQTSV
ncbi:unnamed protein product [Rhodiola kirilowii]